MSTHFLAGVTRKEAVKAYPSALKILKVEGGYTALDTWSDYQVWQKTK